MYTGIKEFNIEGVRRVKLKGRRRGRRERERVHTCRRCKNIIIFLGCFNMAITDKNFFSGVLGEALD